MGQLTDFEKGEILDYKNIHFLGLEAEKINGSALIPHNSGYDDERGDYKVIIRDHLAYRYEVLEILGKGSFGQALKCYDYKKNQHVCVKIIRNKKRFHHQAVIEAKVLKHLKENDPDDKMNIIRMHEFFIFRNHFVFFYAL